MFKLGIGCRKTVTTVTATFTTYFDVISIPFGMIGIFKIRIQGLYKKKGPTIKLI